MTNPAKGPRNRGRSGSRPEGWWQASDGHWYPPNLALHPAAKNEPGAQRLRQEVIDDYSPVLHLGPRWVAWLAPLPLVFLVVGLLLAVGRGRDRVEVIETPAPRAAPGPSPSPGSTDGTTVLAHPGSTGGPGPLGGGGPATSRIETSDGPIATRVSVTTTPSPAAPTTSPEATRATSSSSPAPAPPPAVPDDIDDCKLGGWRHLHDDRGRPFENQGACVRFVEEGGA